MIGCLTENTTCVVAKPLVYSKVVPINYTNFHVALHLKNCNICTCLIFWIKHDLLHIKIQSSKPGRGERET